MLSTAPTNCFLIKHNYLRMIPNTVTVYLKVCTQLLRVAFSAVMSTLVFAEYPQCNMLQHTGHVILDLQL